MEIMRVTVSRRVLTARIGNKRKLNMYIKTALSKVIIYSITIKTSHKTHKEKPLFQFNLTV